jgi:acetyl-CoA carboxylase biotin carboxyl carrier protein
MDLHQIKQILDLVREHELSEFEIEHDGLRLKIRKDLNGVHVVPHAPPVQQSTAPAAAAPAAAPPAPVGGTVAPVEDLGDAEIELAVVKSPIVGTFYRSSEAGSPAFADIGSSVKKGDPCIIEAMKLMNEIDLSMTRDREYLRGNGQPVAWRERLFAIRIR